MTKVHDIVKKSNYIEFKQEGRVRQDKLTNLIAIDNTSMAHADCVPCVHIAKVIQGYILN